MADPQSWEDALPKSATRTMTPIWPSATPEEGWRYDTSVWNTTSDWFISVQQWSHFKCRRKYIDGQKSRLLCVALQAFAGALLKNLKRSCLKSLLMDTCYLHHMFFTQQKHYDMILERTEGSINCFHTAWPHNLTIQEDSSGKDKPNQIKLYLYSTFHTKRQHSALHRRKWGGYKHNYLWHSFSRWKQKKTVHPFGSR